MPIAFASRTTTPKWASALLATMTHCGKSLLSRSVCCTWGDNSKVSHFKEIYELTGVPFDEMVFFDNEWRNIEAVQRLDVNCCYCPDGLTFELFEKAMIS